MISENISRLIKLLGDDFSTLIRYTVKNKSDRNKWQIRLPLVQLGSGHCFIKIQFWSRSYQSLISSFFRFLCFSLIACNIKTKHLLLNDQAKLQKNGKNVHLKKEKSSVGLTLGIA